MRNLPKADVIAAVEACYRMDGDCLDVLAWLTRVHDALSPMLDRGLGTCAYRYDLFGRHLRVHETVERNPAVDVAAMKTSLATVSVDYIAQSYKTLTCAMASEVPGFDDLPSVKYFFRPAGVNDVLAINAFDPEGVGVWVGAFHPKKLELRGRERAGYARISAHVAAGFRLHSRLARAEAQGDAVVTPNGRVVHAEGDAKLGAAREALSGAARAIERSRGSLRRRDPDAALEGWRALVAAQWSLVDQFERDGKRYLVARSNAPGNKMIGALTTRERQVLTCAALGHHTKLIGYELGLAPATVRVLLMRAAKKLQTTTRAATIAKFEALTK